MNDGVIFSFFHNVWQKYVIHVIEKSFKSYMTVKSAQFKNVGSLKNTLLQLNKSLSAFKYEEAILKTFEDLMKKKF